MKQLPVRLEELIRDVQSKSSRALARGELDKNGHDRIYLLSQEILAIAQKGSGVTTNEATPSVPAHQ